MFLTNYDDPIRVGEIVVFKIKDRDIPIVHRVLKVHENEDGEVELLTKGDNNRVDDRGLYAPGQNWLKRDDILGVYSSHVIRVLTSPPATATATAGCMSVRVSITHLMRQKEKRRQMTCLTYLTRCMSFPVTVCLT